jgi:hypothetical protein
MAARNAMSRIDMGSSRSGICGAGAPPVMNKKG